MEALIYARVSEDRRNGRSVDQQVREGRADCADIGANVMAVITDNDIGASPYSKGTRRGWPEVTRLVESGEPDLLWTWEGSRAQRDLEVYVQLRKLCMASGVKWRYGGRTYDLSNWRDRKDTGRDAVDAEAESGQTSERIRRDVRMSAYAGRPHGRRLFGYRRVYDPKTGELDGQELDDAEAVIVRRIFAEYLSGIGAKAIARGIRAEGIRRPETHVRRKGEAEARVVKAEWDDGQVRRVLRNPSYTGRRHYHGEVIEDGGWPAIIDRETWERVQARFSARKQIRQTGTARLLTGVARCGLCGGRMACIHDRNKRKVYACKEKFEVGRDLRRLDAFVTARVLDRLSSPGIADLLDGSEDPAVAQARERADRLKAELDEAWQLRREGRLSLQRFAALETELAPQIAAAERAIRKALVSIELDLPEGDLDEEAWHERFTPEQRREVVAALIIAVTVKPVGRGRRDFDYADYTEIEWRR